MSITIDDVEIAIKILEHFVSLYERAANILRRVQRYGYGGGGEREMITRIIAEALSGRSVAGKEIGREAELTEEDLERFRKVADEIKSKASQSSK